MSLLTYSGYLIAVFAFIFCYPFFPKADFFPFEITPHALLEERNLKNHELTRVEKLFEGQIKGPECFAVYNDKLYVSTHGGAIYQVLPDQLKVVIKLDKPCDGFWQEKVCGRPLGMKFSKNGELFFADAYYGIFKANISTGKVENIISMGNAIDGRLPMLPNSLDIASDGTIYWTDSSTSNYLQDGLLSIFTNGNGRVIKWDPITKENTVILKDLHFPNGIVLSNDETTIYVAETGRLRILKIRLNGKNSYSSVHLDGLVGMPDNLRIHRKNQYCVSMVVSYKNDVNLHRMIAPWHLLRKFIYVTLSGIDNLFYYLDYFFPNVIFKKLNHKIGHFESVKHFTPKGVDILIFDDQSKIVERFYSYDGYVSSISDFIEFDGYYYLGSPYNTYLGRMNV